MKKYTSILLLLLLIAVFTTCKKEPDAPVGGNKIEMGETEVDTVSYFEAQVSSALANTGGNEITQHGHCWGTVNKPTTDDFKTTLGKLDAPKSYTSQLTDLENNTAYYVRSYITYEYGTLYGDEQNLKTLEIGKPIVTTNEVTDITNSKATCGGTNDDGGLTVTQRGVCWNTTGNPTLENSMWHTNDGSGTGSFTSKITGLNDGVTYFVTAYATNELGVSYGQVNSFLASKKDFIDPRDGQTYETVVIGSQTWFAENLNYATSNSWWYNNSSSNGDTYGRLYTWEAALTACPAGWHLPSDDEWKELEMFLGMSQSEADDTGWRGTDEGKKLKSKSRWNNGGNGTDEVGFTALPGGYRYASGGFYRLGLDGYWWSATEYGSASAWYRRLGYGSDEVGRGGYGKDYGFSVRCVKD